MRGIRPLQRAVIPVRPPAANHCAGDLRIAEVIGQLAAGLPRLADLQRDRLDPANIADVKVCFVHPRDFDCGDRSITIEPDGRLIPDSRC